MKLLLCSVGALAFVSGAALADDVQSAMQAYLESHIAPWASDPAIIAAIRAQNARTAGFDQARIDALDQTWRAEVGAASTPTITPVLEGSAAEFLRGQVDASGGVITEIFLMDARGLNVAASAVTSDMWQGDEAKFTETYPRGAGAVHFSEVEFDESSQRYQAQISVAIGDPATGEVLGAMTVGVDAEALM